MTITIRLINKNDTSKSCFETNGAAPSEKEFGEVVPDWCIALPLTPLGVSTSLERFGAEGEAGTKILHALLVQDLLVYSGWSSQQQF